MVVAVAVLVVEHEDGAGAGLVGERLAADGIRLDVRRPWRGEELPAGLADHAGLLVLGGSVGCRDDTAAPWLAPVRELVREAVRREVPLLGICLGGQLVADALGGAVAARPRGPEVGSVPVRRLPGAAGDPVFGRVPDGAPAAQWHFDDITRLPEGAVPLLGGDACRYQAYRVGAAAWGVQFHPEVDGDAVAVWARADAAAVRGRGGDPDAAVASVRRDGEALREVWGAVAGAWGGVVREWAAADAAR
ncbi:MULTISPECIES: type 1 glutamine amidotransferase [Streptomyces]|uniref:Type 1 glutamine amidotransferase n=2 Tax=Streptomyces TaxID=1883 RepID=A0ABU4KDH2_9ACTN|nr:type 1 glutamine amidotransferase [Streptomyces roseolus]MDX2295796.1 type 1 glutamine amidotransferase [Streptomyces roseolus]